VLVGDINVAESKKLIETYFGDIPAQPKPLTPDLAEPGGAKAHKDVYKDPLAKVPGVVVGYPGPVRHSPDYYALTMVDVLLTGGESSRFQLDLVKGKKSVIQYQAELGWPTTSSLDYKDPGFYAMFFLHKPNFTGSQIVDHAQEEISRIQTEGVGAKELDRARTLLRSERLEVLQSSLQRAQQLGKYEVLDGKPELINTVLDRLLAVSAEQIQAVAKKYLTPERRSVLEIQKAPGIAASEGSR
jgi:zinc protease